MDAYKYVEEKLNDLDLAVQALSRVASEAVGTELHADVCSGDEIEFRLTHPHRGHHGDDRQTQFNNKKKKKQSLC